MNAAYNERKMIWTLQNTADNVNDQITSEYISTV